MVEILLSLDPDRSSSKISILGTLSLGELSTLAGIGPPLFLKTLEMYCFSLDDLSNVKSFEPDNCSSLRLMPNSSLKMRYGLFF